MPYLPESMAGLHNRPNSGVTKPVFPLLVPEKGDSSYPQPYWWSCFSPAKLFLPADNATHPYAVIARPICSGHCIRHEDCKHTDNMPMHASLPPPPLFQQSSGRKSPFQPACSPRHSYKKESTESLSLGLLPTACLF